MIIQLVPYDITTASPARLVNTAGLWEALPRIARGLPSARLLMVADTLKKETILEGFQQVATPEKHLPPGVLAYRIDYEDFLNRTIQAVRYIRLYLVVDTLLEETSLIGLLGAFGVQAFPLDHELPRPFTGMAASEWSSIRADDGRYFALLRTRFNQRTALLHPRTLHNLLAQDFPVWAALQIHTFPQRETMRLLRQKAAAAQFNGNKSIDGVQDANEANQGVMSVREAVSRGEAMHTASLYVLVDAPDEQTLNGRVEIVRGAVPLEMERIYAPGRVLPTLFSAETLTETDGTMMTTTGAALLAGSALSYRRRTTTKGILLGIDRNQAPVILDIFDDRNPSYNTVVLGQTGSGKTFTVQVLLLRHLLMGMRLVIIDPQGNVDLGFLGPDVYQRSVLGTSDASVNVLDIINTEIGSQVEMAISMLRMLGVHRDEPMERALLDEALMSLYQPIWGKDGAPAPTLTDLHDFMEARVGKSSLENVRQTAGMLALSLSNYVRGSRADLFGKPTSVLSVWWIVSVTGWKLISPVSAFQART
ncbi:MAG: type IV secretory system conjugative DNA transfer family protein [Anaerolineales bacterium]